MESAQAQLADKLKSSNNILVTVSRDPSVDQLAACIGLTILLNKFNKHAAAVFSGKVPSTIEFLQPGETIETNTDSLRDFIIALDKSKADKLRYKVENDVVRIFITPYKTSISDADLEFSQGDFNVDVVVALGVQRQEDLDEAITAHGRILHDATVTSITTSNEGGLGSINWQEPQASSLSELVTELAQSLNPELIDNQVATALLTGIVAETERFSNAKTSSQTMSASAALMAAGADQQLVASKLENPEPEQPKDDAAKPSEPSDDNTSDNESKDQEKHDGDSSGDVDESKGNNGADEEHEDEDKKDSDGTLEIEHSGKPEAEDSEHNDEAADTRDDYKDDDKDDGKNDDDDDKDGNKSDSQNADFSLPEPQLEAPAGDSDDGTDDQLATAFNLESLNSQSDDQPASQDPQDWHDQPSPPTDTPASKPLMTTPPSLGGTLTANSQPEALDPTTDPFSASQTDRPPLLDRDLSKLTPTPASPLSPPQPPSPAVVTSQPEPIISGLTPPPPAWVPPSAPPPPASETLSDIETALQSPHVVPPEGLHDARDEVSRALDSSATPPPPPPIQALNAQPMGDSLHPDPSGPPPLLSDAPVPTPVVTNPAPIAPVNENIVPLPSPEPLNSLIPPPPAAPMQPAPPPPVNPVMTPQVTDANAPPPVPPPIPFQFNAPPPAQ